MGPQFSAAELFRPSRLDAGAPKQFAPPKSSNDFQRYLDDARSDLSSSDKPSDTPAPRDRETASEKTRRDGDAPSADDASQQLNAVIDTPVEPAPFVIVGASSINNEQSPDVSAAGSDSTPESSDKPAPLPPGYCPTTRPFFHLSTGPITPHGTKPMPQVPLPTIPTEGPVPPEDLKLQLSSDPSNTTGKIDGETHESANSLPAQNTQVSPEASEKTPIKAAQLQASALQNVNLNKGSRKIEPSVEKVTAPNKNRTQSGARTETRTVARSFESENDSIQKQKMTLSTQQADQVAVQEKDNSRNVSNKLDRHAAITANASKLESRQSNEVVDAESQTISVVSAKGDEPAVAIARFLMLGPQEDVTANSSNNSAANITALPHAATANSNSNSSPVSNLNAPQGILDAHAEQKDGLDGAVRLMQAGKGGGKFQVTLQLDPPQLGPIKLQIQMRDQDMTMQVDTQTHGVARLMESRLSELRDALASHGITIDRADISVRAAERGDPAQHKQDQSQTQDSGQRSSDWGQHSQGSEDPGHHSWREEQYGWSWANAYGSDGLERLGAKVLNSDPLIETENAFLGHGSVNLIA